MIDDLEIPEFLRREMPDGWVSPSHRARARERKIPYPKDGYAGKGLRSAARERLRESRRRHAEKIRQRKKPNKTGGK